MTIENLKEALDKHLKWTNKEPRGTRANLQEADLRGVDLREVYLRGADLRGEDLRGVDLDYSFWPLWCGSLDVRVDKRIAAQLAYHFCRLDCDDPEYIKFRNMLLPFANQFHRVGECGKLEEIQLPKKGGLNDV